MFASRHNIDLQQGLQKDRDQADVRDSTVSSIGLHRGCAKTSTQPARKTLLF